MASVDSSTDVRPGWLRVLVLAGTVLLLVIGLPMLLLGVGLLARPEGPFVLCVGLLLTALGVLSVVREVGEVRHRRDPPRPRLDRLDAEAALVLPRAPFASLVSAWSLVAFAVVCLLGAAFAATVSRWVLGLVLLVVAGVCLWVAQPHRARSLAGGLWLTPTRIVSEHDGTRWEAPWDDVHGAVPGQVLAVLVHHGRVPAVSRGPAAWRHSGRAVVDGVPVVDARHLAGGSVLAAYVVEKAVQDPGFRAALGTPESLPPA